MRIFTGKSTPLSDFKSGETPHLGATVVGHQQDSILKDPVSIGLAAGHSAVGIRRPVVSSSLLALTVAVSNLSGIKHDSSPNFQSRVKSSRNRIRG